VPRRYVLFLGVALVVVLLDQWTKYLAVEHLTALFDPHRETAQRLSALYSEPPPQRGPFHFPARGHIDVIDEHLRFRYAENPGAAFGLFRNFPPNVRGPLFHMVSLAAIVLIVWFFRKLSGKPDEKWALWALPLILGGAIGNYIDRIARGFVIDFIEAHWKDRAYWPTFNIADMAISIGVALLLFDSFVRREPKKTSQAGQPPP
jgi:signal peptidase II